MNENPLMILLYVGVAAYVGQIYWGDYKAVKSGEADAGAMPGAVAAPLGAFTVSYTHLTLPTTWLVV